MAKTWKENLWYWVKEILWKLAEWIVIGFLYLLEVVRLIAYWILRKVVIFTYWGCWIGGILWLINGYEMINGTFILETTYFKEALFLCVLHLIVFWVCFWLRPNDV